MKPEWIQRVAAQYFDTIYVQYGTRCLARALVRGQVRFLFAQAGLEERSTVSYAWQLGYGREISRGVLKVAGGSKCTLLYTAQ